MLQLQKNDTDFYQRLMLALEEKVQVLFICSSHLQHAQFCPHPIDNRSWLVRWFNNR